MGGGDEGRKGDFYLLSERKDKKLFNTARFSEILMSYHLNFYKISYILIKNDLYVHRYFFQWVPNGVH